jgi:hypothetical protein
VVFISYNALNTKYAIYKPILHSMNLSSKNESTHPQVFLLKFQTAPNGEHTNILPICESSIGLSSEYLNYSAERAASVSIDGASHPHPAGLQLQIREGRLGLVDSDKLDLAQGFSLEHLLESATLKQDHGVFASDLFLLNVQAQRRNGLARSMLLGA